MLNYLSIFDLKLVFLNACDTYPVGANLFADESKTANKFAPTVICAKGKIDDSVAIEFSKTFYLHLANGEAIRKAFELAKNAQKMTENKSKSPNDWHLLGTEESKNWKFEILLSEKKEAKTIQIAEKIYNIGSADHSTFN